MILMKKENVLVLIFVFLLPLFLVLFAYKTTLLLIPQSPEQKETIAYLKSGEMLTLKYTPLEKSHLEDVKRVMTYTDYVFGGLFLVLMSIVVYFRKKRAVLKKMCLYGGIATISILAIIVILTTLFFDQAFILFHLLLFPQGNWTFAADSLLIETFPLEFFMRMSLLIFLQTLVLGAILRIGAYFLEKRI